MVTLKTETKNTGEYVFFLAEAGEIFRVWITPISTRDELKMWVDFLSSKNWFTSDLRNQFTDICEKRLTDF